MKKLKKRFSLAIAFIMLLGLFSGYAAVSSNAILTVRSGVQIDLTDWKIAPSGHLTVGETEYPLTAGLPAAVPTAAAATAGATADWVDAKAPGTVVGALLDAGKYDGLLGNTDVYYDANMTKIPFTDFAKPWWWRTNVDIPASESGKKVTLTFKGINYTGRIWVNGQELSNVNIHITDIKELQNRTGTFPIYSYLTPTLRSPFLTIN